MDLSLPGAEVSPAGWVRRRSRRLPSHVVVADWGGCSCLGTGAGLYSWSSRPCRSCIPSSDCTPTEPHPHH